MEELVQMLSLDASWPIDWYVCRADRHDVDAGVADTVGEELWRVPLSIGPLYPDENHWAKNHIDCDKEDAYLVAAAPKMLAVLREVMEEASNAGGGARVLPPHLFERIGLVVYEALEGPDAA